LASLRRQFRARGRTDFAEPSISKIPASEAARELGMGAVDRIAPLRKFFMRHAVGDLGVLPRLLRRGGVKVPARKRFRR